MQISIPTDRLSLDILTNEDYEFIISLLNSKGWIEFIGDRNVHSKEEAIIYINKILHTAHFHYWVIRQKSDNIPVGIISFIKRDYLEYYDIGFALLPEFSGNGYAFEAAKEVLFIMTTKFHHHPILATLLPANTSSIKLLEKLGLNFEKEIEVRDEKLLLYSNSVMMQAPSG